MRIAALALLSALLLAAPTAVAQQPSAADLFKQGVTLFNRGDVGAACSKFEESYKLDAATGTLFNLAGCHEKEGQLWIARGEYLKLANEMTAAGKTDKAELARKRAAAVEALLPKVSLVFSSDSNATSIELDSKPLSKDTWHNPIPVDLGSHLLAFRAQGMQAQTITVAADRQGVTKIVNVPALAPATSNAPRTSTGSAPPSAPAAQEPKPEEADHGAAPASLFWTTKREAGAIVGGVGVIGLGIGAVFGIEALSQKSKADDACGTTSGPCLDAQHTTAAKSEIHTAEDTARVSTIAFGASIAALGVGAYLFLSDGFSPKAETSAHALRFTPTAGPDAAGFTVDGKF